MVAARSSSPRAGFTLTEILVVVAIIVVLAGIAVPITLNVLSDARRDIATSHMKGTLMPAAKAYQARYVEPPANLNMLLAKSLGGAGSLTQESLIDPWGRPYQLAIAGGDGEDAIITIWTDGPSPGAADSRIEVNSVGGQSQNVP